MIKGIRRNHKIALGLFLFALLGILVVVVISRKVEKMIETEFGEELEYEDLKVNVLQKRLLLTEPRLKMDDLQLEATQIKVLGFGVWQYLTQETIVIEEVLFTDPDIRYFPQETDSSTVSEDSTKSRLQLFIHNVEVDHGSFRILKDDSEELYLSFDHVSITELGTAEAAKETGLPFSYSTYEIVGDSLFSQLDERHYLTLNRLQAREGEAWAEDLRIVPKYGKMEFQQHIPHEMDRFELLVEKIHLEGLLWGLEDDGLFMEARLLEIAGADLEVYRDKLQPEDTSIKPMYSEQVRNAPITFGIGKVEVKESSIVYEERIDEERPAAKVFFTNLYSSIYNLGNSGLRSADFPETRIAAQANFMGEPLVKVDWVFDSSNLEEEFRISGEFGSLSAEGINSFLKPAMNVEARGGISSLAFDFRGNNEEATGKMELEYQDFKIDVLRDDGSKKNNFFSAIANFFINNNSINDEVHHDDLQVQRDKTKSFWNFLWLCIREGAISSLLK